jgi:hypothetical protein
MRFSTQATLGTPLPARVDLKFSDTLQIFIQDDNGNPLVATSIYLTSRDPQSSSQGGSLNAQGLLGNDPAATSAALTAFPSAYATISGSSVMYLASAASANAQPVRAIIVAVSGSAQRSLEINVS